MRASAHASRRMATGKASPAAVLRDALAHWAEAPQDDGCCLLTRPTPYAAMALVRFSDDLVEELGRGEPLLIGADQDRQVLGHVAGLDRADRDLLEGRGKARQRVVVVELGAMREPARPGIDRGDRVGRGLLALLMLAEVARHRAVRGLGLDHLAVRRHQHRGHQAERAIALRDRVGLHVAVVVLARPHIAARPLQRGRDHVVDQPVLVEDLLLLERGLELLLVDLLEDVLEAAVIDFDDRVLGGEIDRIAAVETIVERGTREVADRVVEVVHRHGDASAGELEHLALDLGAVLTDEAQRELALARHLEVGRAVLVAIGVAADDDRLRPARHQARHVLADDRLAEDDAAQDVADGAVGRTVHLLEAELLHPRLVRRDGRALHADAHFPDLVGGVDGDLVVGLVALLHAEIVIEKIDIEIRMDQLVLDVLPDDPGHLVAVEFDHRIGNLDLSHAGTFQRRDWTGGVGNLAGGRRYSIGPWAVKAG